MTTSRSTWRRAALLPPLLFALWLLTDDDTSGSSNHHHLAVVTALYRHPPSLRVYRSLLEINLLLWGGVVSLLIWHRTLGSKMVGHLLFQPAEPSKEDTSYQRIAGETDGLFEEPEGDFVGQERNLTEEEAMDAQWDNNEGSEGIPDPVEETFEPPSVVSVAGAALDSLLLILVSLFFFTLSSAEGGRYVDGMASFETFKFIALVAAPVLPLLLFIGGAVAITFPWKKRKDFWLVLSYTIGAPFSKVTFRDGFIGDILTSSVRPMQDTAFTVFYLLSGLQGWWSQSYELDDADLPLEKNWLLHTCVLPMCMVSPLWWRFLQNLRQSYESKQRWPYLGNALKYFVAAEVALFGVFDPSKKQTYLWLSCFVIATLYQIWWDVFMDWELLVVDRSGVRLRRTRIYPHRWMYWAIFAVNVVLRFCWTLSFLPPHYLNKAGVLSRTFEGDISSVLEPTIASAEIIRRTLWGFLRVEMEAIKVGRKEPRLKGPWADDSSSNLDRDIELKVMSMKGVDPFQPTPTIYGAVLASDMSTLSDIQILGELCLWATAFTSLGMIAAAHRVTL